MGLFADSDRDSVDKYLPDGPIKDLGESYIDNLPDVENAPFTLDYFIQSDNSWADFAVAYLLLYPYVVFLVAIVAWGVYFLWRRIGMRLECRRREPCLNCGTLEYLCAIRCPECNTCHPRPRKLGLGGFSRSGSLAEKNRRNRLRRFRRCHVCGEFLKPRRLDQCCPACGSLVFLSHDQLERYDRYVQHWRWEVYISVFLFNWVPIVGPLLASSIYRRVLIAPYGHYMTFGRERLLFLVLSIFRFLFRYLPFIGILGMPVLAVVENRVYRKFFFREAGMNRS